MLQTERLTRARVNISTNPCLQKLYASVIDYNQFSVLPGAQLPMKAKKLQKVIVNAGTYLTSKPPQPRVGKAVRTNELRWNALAQLVKEAGREADRLNIRTLHGLGNIRGNPKWSGPNENVWLEVIDPYHRHGGELSDQWKLWTTNKDCIDKRKSFWDHIGTPIDGADEGMIDYINGHKHRTHFEGQRLLDIDGVPVDTSKMSSIWSGPFWGIFALSVKRELYVGEHRRREFHHSSFLRGKPVQAAGEMVVIDGTIAVINAKTGHYWTQPQQMRAMVIALPGIPDSALISPVVVECKQDRIYYRCGDYRRWGNQAKKVSWEEHCAHVTGLLPAKPIEVKPDNYKRNRDAEGGSKTEQGGYQNPGLKGKTEDGGYQNPGLKS